MDASYYITYSGHEVRVTNDGSNEESAVSGSLTFSHLCDNHMTIS